MLVVQPFRQFTTSESEAVTAEGASLLAVLAPLSPAREVRLLQPR